MPGHSAHRRASNVNAQSGTAAVEFALILLIFLTFIFGIMELARSMYIYNTLQEVTRRAAAAAANADFSVASTDKIRRYAIFRAPADTGGLLFGNPVTAAHIRIDFMALERVGNDTTPKLISSAQLEASSPAANRLTCMRNSNDENCVRLVRVQVCQPGTDCVPVPYEPVFPLISLPFNLPVARTIVAAETLGLAVAP
jgi:hypothetical protein